MTATELPLRPRTAVDQLSRDERLNLPADTIERLTCTVLSDVR